MSEVEKSLKSQRDGSWNPVAEHLGTAFAFAGGLSAIVSFIYDWGFFFSLGISFGEAPTGISDHVRTWLVWLPIVITPVLVLLAHELFMSRLEGGLTEKEIVESSRNPAQLRWFRRSPQVAVSIMAVLAVLLWALFGEAFSHIRVATFPIAWAVFVDFVFCSPLLDARYSSVTKNIVTYLPAAFFFAFFAGANAATTEMLQSSNSHRLEFAGTTQGQGEEEVRMLRSFQHWLLIRDKTGEVAWIHVNNIGRMQLLEESAAFGGIICYFFSTQWCRDDSP